LELVGRPLLHSCSSATEFSRYSRIQELLFIFASVSRNLRDEALHDTPLAPYPAQFDRQHGLDLFVALAVN